MFGSANVLVCAVEVKEGDIYNWETIDKIDRITRRLLVLSGSNPTQLVSLTHPRLKDVKVTGWGIKIQPLINDSISRNELGLKNIRYAVHTNEGIIGFYVSEDEKKAAIYAGFWEEGVNPINLYEEIQEIQKIEGNENTNIHFTGYPALYAYVYHLAPQIYYVFIGTFIILILLLYLYFRSLSGVLLPMISAGVSGIWGLGFISLLGYSLDPLILVVPVVITARAVSHSVQCLARYNEERMHHDHLKAIVKGYGELFAPATLAIITDAIGLLLISVSTIPLMRYLGIFASFWIITIVVTVPTLTPILLSYFKTPIAPTNKSGCIKSIYSHIGAWLVSPSYGKARYAVIFIALMILVIGPFFAIKLKPGNTEAGEALLYASHPYNKSFDFFNRNFVGATQLVVVVEGKTENAIRDYETLNSMASFQRYMETEGKAGGTLAFNNFIMRIYRMFHEGYPKWEMIPKDQTVLRQISQLILINSNPGEMNRFVSEDWKDATITCFYKEFNNELIKNVLSTAGKYIENNSTENADFRLAGGFMGIMAAVNEEVEFSYWVSLIVVFLTVFALCTITFKSIAAGFCLIIPLAISQIVSELFMLAKGIDLNFNSLPVAAIAAGIGIDYGIYLLARIKEETKSTDNLKAAISEAVQTTGAAIIFTATTIIGGVILWIFVDLKFQSEMGMLIALLMLLNMVCALIIIPSMAMTFKPKKIFAQSMKSDAEAQQSNSLQS